MRLYADPISTTSRPVTFLVAHAGIALEIVPISLMAGATREPGFLAMNPMGKVPVLVDSDFVLTECAAILRYLAARAAPRLYPAGLRERARVDEAISWFGSDLYTALAVMTVYPRALGAKGMSPGTVAELTDAAAPQVQRVLDVLDARLGDERHVAGPDLTIADFQALAYVTVAELIAFDFRPWPRVAGWIDRMKRLPGWPDAYAAFNALAAARRERAAAQPAPQPASRGD